MTSQAAFSRARSDLRENFNRISRELGATEQEAERAMRQAIMRATRTVRAKATRNISGKLRIAKGRQASVRRRLRLYNKRYPRGHRGSVWLGMIGIGAEIYYSKAQARSALKKQNSIGGRKRSGQVVYRGNTIQRSFWMDAHGRNDPIAFIRTGRGRKDIRRAHVPFLRDAGPQLTSAGVGINTAVVAEFARYLKVLVDARVR